MGRCADAVLEGRNDVIRVFCYASYEDCLNRTKEVCGLDDREAEKRIVEVDKFRAAYYKHFTGNLIDEARNYDLCINTGSRSVETLVEFVRGYVNSISIY